MHLLASLQALAHGSDTVQYFQWRKSRGSVEKFHGAVVDHCGHEHTRVFKEVSEVGKALEKLDDIVGTSVKPEVAIIYDWKSMGIEDARGFNNNAKSILKLLLSIILDLEKGVPVDIIDMEQSLSQYKIVVAPMLYMLRGDIAKRIEEFVKGGGTFVATYLTGLVNENDLCFLGGFPGSLRNILGVWTEETDSLHPEEFNEVNVHIEALNGKTYKVVDMCDMIHLETAKSLATYASDFYAGQPALTVNKFGEGQAYYIAFRNNQDFEEEFYANLIQELQLKPVLEAKLPEGVSVQTRYDENNTFIFIMNFTEKTQSLDIGSVDIENILEGISEHGKVSIDGYGVKIYKNKNRTI